jgi:hypothetical protein
VRMTFLLALLTSRVIRSIDYLKGREDESLGRLPIATFGASTGAAGMSYGSLSKHANNFLKSCTRSGGIPSKRCLLCCFSRWTS